MLKNFHSPLRHNPANSRYFTDDTGRAIYLTGSYTWANFQEIKTEEKIYFSPLPSARTGPRPLTRMQYTSITLNNCE